MIGRTSQSDEIRGLEHFWRRQTGRAPPHFTGDMADHLLLAALGLGLEQTAAFLAHERPDLGAFHDWIEATAGPPCAETIARYHAALDGAPPPAATASRLAAINAMEPVLGLEEQRRFEHDGYAILRSAIDPAAAADAAAVVLAATGARLDDPASWYGPRTNDIMVQLFQHPALAVARAAPHVHKAFAQLWGTSDLWMIVDRASFNPPLRPGGGFAPTRLHWDVSLVQPVPFATQGILYLCDVAEDQGALELVPGFHHLLPAWLDGLGDDDPRRIDLSAEAIRIPARAGDLIIWRQDLPHGASPNRAGRPRIAQYVNMFPAALRQQTLWR